MITIIHCLNFRASQSHCNSSFDCALSGDCTNGECICDPGWKGPHCTTFDLLPTPSNSGFHNINATWGGSPIETSNGNIYMLATIIGTGSPGLVWCTHGTIAIAQAVNNSSPAGPYKVITSLINHGSVHCTGVINPVIIATNSSTPTYILYYSCGNCHNDPNSTINCEDPVYCNNTLRMSYTTNPDLTDLNSWIHVQSDLFEPNFTNWENGINDNPGPVIFRDTSDGVLLSYRAGGSGKHSISLVMSGSNNFKNIPYTHENNGNILFINDSRSQSLEDPFIWKTERGYHMLMHYLGSSDQDSDVGTIAWSIDGLSWRLNQLGEGAYNHTLVYENGTNFNCQHREEPKLLIQNDKPTYLANVCYYNHRSGFVAMAPINDK